MMTENEQARLPGDYQRRKTYCLEKMIDGEWYIHGRYGSIDRLAKAANALGEYGIHVRVKERECD